MSLLKLILMLRQKFKLLLNLYIQFLVVLVPILTISIVNSQEGGSSQVVGKFELSFPTNKKSGKIHKN